jgi:Tfp pilus assembly protein PilO
MKRLPPAKRNQLIVVILATLGLIGLVYFLLIQSQKEQNRKLAHDTSVKMAELETIKKSIKQAELINANLTDITQQLDHAEDDVVTGDVYGWIYDTIRKFKSTYHVDIPNIGQPAISDVDLIAGFPYKQVKVSLSGTAYYHDLGKFIADFENTFPHIRVVNLSLEPGNVSGSGPNNGAEKLTFRMDVIALIKPNT